MLRRAAGLLLVFLLLIGIPGCGIADLEGDVLRYNLGPEPETLDPALATGEPELTVILAAFEGLTRLAPGGEIQEGVAEDWTISPDGLTYTFTLREDARWSNGEPVVAQDFVYSWRRVLDPATASRYAYQLYCLKNGAAFNSGEITDPELVGVKALDEHTLQVELEGPVDYFLSLTAFPTYFPVFREKVEEDPEAWWRSPGTYVGNGPFRLERWEGRQRLFLVPNEHYWDAEEIDLDGLELTLVEEPATALALFEGGDLDLVTSLPPGELERLDGEGQLRTIEDMAVFFFMLNTTHPPLDDVQVRRALALALEREDLVNYVTRGGEEPALALVPPGVEIEGKDFRWDGGDLFPDGAGDEARQLLDQAGFPQGEGFPTITLFFPDSSLYRLLAEATQEMWRRELGVDVSLAPLEWRAFFSTLAQGEYDLGLVAWNADYIDPVNFLEVCVSGGGNNFTGWGNRDFDDLLRGAQETVDRSQRVQLLHKAERILMEEMPVIPLYFPVRNYVQAEDLSGVFISPLGLVDFKGAGFT